MGKSILEIKNLTKSYGKARGIIDVNFIVEEGEFFGFIGPNGAGKTTALSLMSGLLPCKQGKIKLFGKNINKYKYDELYGKTIGVLPQKCESLFGGYTVREDLDKAREYAQKLIGE